MTRDRGTTPLGVADRALAPELIKTAGFSNSRNLSENYLVFSDTQTQTLSLIYRLADRLASAFSGINNAD